jgi:recombination protein RecT
MTNELIKIKERIIDSPLLKNILSEDLEKYATNIVAEIAKTRGDDKKDLSKCSADSIVSAIKQACDLNLTIDSRQHCHLIKYGNVAQLQIGYRGFIYSIKRAYQDANIDVQLVYEGDDFKLIKEGDVTTYSLTRNNPFAAKDKIIGGFCYISYKLGDRLVSFCETMSIDEINKIKGCAKQDFIWKAWFEEKAKVAIIKRACKIHFSGINENISQISEYDNQEYDLSKNINIIEGSIEKISQEQVAQIEKLAQMKNIDIIKICKSFAINSLEELPINEFDLLIKTLSSK